MCISVVYGSIVVEFMGCNFYEDHRARQAPWNILLAIVAITTILADIRVIITCR